MRDVSLSLPLSLPLPLPPLSLCVCLCLSFDLSVSASLSLSGSQHYLLTCDLPTTTTTLHTQAENDWPAGLMPPVRRVPRGRRSHPTHWPAAAAAAAVAISWAGRRTRSVVWVGGLFLYTIGLISFPSRVCLCCVCCWRPTDRPTDRPADGHEIAAHLCTSTDGRTHVLYMCTHTTDTCTRGFWTT
jgi:hypothetical protein